MIVITQNGTKTVGDLMKPATSVEDGFKLSYVSEVRIRFILFYYVRTYEVLSSQVMNSVLCSCQLGFKKQRLGEETDCAK